MQRGYSFTAEDGTSAEVKFEVTEDECEVGEKRYGISATIKSGEKYETEKAGNCFFTYAEAECTVEMLCRNQVTPCTMRDVIFG